jgi:hypothetical protein
MRFAVFSAQAARPQIASFGDMGMFRDYRGLSGISDMRHLDSDAESTAWPMICEHADPCHPSPMLSTQMGRGAGPRKCVLTDDVISQRQRRAIQCDL